MGIAQVIVMVANNSGTMVRHLAESWPGRIGWIIPPDGWRKPWLPYALDNGAFPIWTRGGIWDEAAFYRLCEKTRQHERPLWIAVPDVVANREATLESWEKHWPAVQCYGPLAFVVQDGMTPEDVPENADVVFVGGTTKWKWRSLRTWCENFPRVHVGRANTERMLWMAHDCGAESCDGTGWFRGDQVQFAGLLSYLEQSTNGRAQIEMPLA